MNKYLVLFGILLLMWLMIGCGIPQEQYDAIASDLAKTQAELQTTQAKVTELTSGLEKAETEAKANKAKNSELTLSLEKRQTELEEAQGKTSELTASLENTKSELEAAESEYASFKSETKSTWERFDKIIALEWLFARYWSEAAKGNNEAVEQFTVKMVSYVEPIGDSTMNSLWRQALDAAEKGQDTLFLESFAALMDRNSSLLKAEAKAIRDALD
jgi:chromosome segregation ATPase